MTDNPFPKMRELFGPDGAAWRKRTYGTSTGPKCLIGAAVVASGFNIETFFLKPAPSIERVRDFMGQVLTEKIGPQEWLDGTVMPQCVVSWNDAPERTFADIEWLLSECEHRWEIEHG